MDGLFQVDNGHDHEDEESAGLEDGAASIWHLLVYLSDQEHKEIAHN